MNSSQDVYQAPPLFLAFMPEMADGVILVAFQNFSYRAEPQGKNTILSLSDNQAEYSIFFFPRNSKGTFLFFSAQAVEPPVFLLRIFAQQKSRAT